MRPAVGGRPLAPLPLVDRFHGDPGLVRRVRWFCDDGGRDQVVAGFVRLVLFGDARDGGFDRFAETGLRLRAVAVPVGAPDAVQIPAEAAQYLLPQAVPVPCGLGRVVPGAVALDAQREPAGERGLADRDVAPVAAHAGPPLDGGAPAR